MKYKIAIVDVKGMLFGIPVNKLDSLDKHVKAVIYSEAALKSFEQLDDVNAAKVQKQLTEWRK